MKKDIDNSERQHLSPEAESAVRAYITEISKNQSFYRRMKNRYLGIKYRIQDWIEEKIGN